MRRFRFSRTTTVISLWGLATVVNGWVLFAPPDHAGDSLGWRRFETPAITPNLQLAQTFRMNASGLNAIDLRGAAVGPVAGRIRLELVDLDVNGGPTLVRDAEIDATVLVQREEYRFQFASIEASQNHLFRLDISSSPEAPSAGVAFWATKGERFRNGTLLSNDRERWADLAFQTHTPAKSTLQALLDSPRLPRASGRVTLAGLFVAWFALGAVLREAAKPDEPA